MSANNRLRVILIGSGNVAAILGEALLKAGAEIVQVYDRKIENAKLLAKKIKAKAIADLSKIDNKPALIVIAVKDDAINAIVGKIKMNDGIVVHTSGSINMNVLKKFRQHGIIYPLQTFSKSRKINLENVPICIEGNDVDTLFSLTNIAETISDCVYHLDSKQREAVHLAAVFANNFTNHLYSIAEDLLKENKLPFDLIRPLIAETAAKVQELLPAEAQTGPALRNDKLVMKKQLSLLQKHPGLKKIYSEMSSGISGKVKKKK
jgi:predicted short-subunit dehydrogenase-like oxidoreductase (DUF2520 family)